MSTAARNVDVSHLPTTVFGSRSPTWWGTLGFVAVESMMLAVGVFAYVYLRRNFESYPPSGTPLPDILLPTAGLLLLLASNVPARLTHRAARRYDREDARKWLLVQVGVGLLVLTIRGFEFLAVNTRWDTDAYGSVVWFILGFHTMHLMIDVLESAVMVSILHRGPVEEKHFVDTADGAFYWYYVSFIWVPLYAVIYLAPRWL